MSRRGARARRAAWPAWCAAAALALALAGCAGLRLQPPAGEGPAAAPGPEAPPALPAVPLTPPASAPGTRAGLTAWTVGALRLEAPAGWGAETRAGRLSLDAGGRGRLDAAALGERHPDQAACLAAAEEALARGEARLSRVRRHATTLAGRPAVVQEADDGPWHGWAYAVCQGGVQHRLSFTGRSPIGADLLEAWREVVSSARLGGGR